MTRTLRLACAVALISLAIAIPTFAAPGGGGGGLQQCQASLNTCTTSLNSCNSNLTTCSSNLSSTQASLGTCTTDLAACQASAQSFPATGQTSCWDSSGTSVTCAGTGQDGDVKAGAVLRYDATTDGGLTITDNNTKLVWEKKTYCLVADPTNDPHCYGNLYTWQAALDYIKALNNTRFAGHNDWRLPNVKELQSIVNYQNWSPAVSSEFNVCGSTPGSGSCTIATSYWSSSVYAQFPNNAWYVSFFDGDMHWASRGNSGYVLCRAGRPLMCRIA